MKVLCSKAIAVFASIMLAVSLVPLPSFPTAASAAEAGGGVQKIADPDTSGSWRSLFDMRSDSDEEPFYSTQESGRIWVDKSVYADEGSALSSGIPDVSMVDPGNDFLVGLSTISASSSVRTESPYGHDVVFVVSLNSAMAGLNYDGETYLAHIADALNRSIGRLMEEGAGSGGAARKARVAVIGYSVDVTVLMPLDSYQPDSEGNYVVFSDDIAGGAGLVPVCTPEAQGVQTKSEIVRGSAYLQKALAASSDILQNAAHDATSNAPRKPDIVVMGAAVPLMANSNVLDPPEYRNETAEEDGFVGSMPANNNAVGYGTDAAFATLLTLQKERTDVDAAYDAGNAASPSNAQDNLGVWTVGLDTSGMAAYALQTASWQARASIPEKVGGSTVDLAQNMKAACRAYGRAADAGSSSVMLSLYGTNTGGIMAETVPFIPAPGLLDASDDYAFDGADAYFHATDAGALPGGFDAAVNRILGIDYNSPVNEGEGSSTDSSDRLRVQDDIGHLMNVKKVDGILYQNRLLDGSKAAQAVTVSFHDPWDVESYHEVQCIMDSLNERYDLGWDAYTLLYDAFTDGQFAYRGANDYSNYVAWYVNPEHQMVKTSGAPYTFASTQEVEAAASGDWQDKASQSVKSKIESAQASGATAICQTYFYIGNIEGQYAGDDVPLYDFVVMVETSLETGDQRLLLTIPADSIPSRKANVTVHLDGTTTMELGPDAEETFPLRVVYEVGPRKDVAELADRISAGENVSDSEIEQVLGANAPRNASGEYLLCTNAYQGEGDSASALTVMSAVAASTNAYYSFTKDTPLFVPKPGTALPDGQNPTEDQLEPLKEKPQADATYYYADTYYQADGLKYGTEAPAHAVTTYEPYVIPDDGTFNESNYGVAQDGQYFATAGTPKHVVSAMLENYAKNPNATATAPYVKQLSISDYSSLGRPMVSARLGNNGIFALQPAQKTASLTVAKQLEQGDEHAPILESDKEHPFSFEVILRNEDGTPLGGTATVLESENGVKELMELENGVVRLNLKDGQSATIEGLPTGTLYEVRELLDGNAAGLYEPSFQTTVNGTATNAASSDSTDEETLEEGSTTVSFTNTKHGGSVIVSKQTAGNAADPAQSFPFEIQLTEKDGTPASGTYAYGLFNGSNPEDWDAWSLGTATVDEDGTVLLEDGRTPALADGQSIALAGIPTGASYSVSEEENDGYTTSASVQTVGSGAVSDGNAGTIETTGQVDVVTFTNERWSYGTLEIAKHVEGDFAENKVFPFSVRLTDATGSPLSGSVEFHVQGSDGSPGSVQAATLDPDGALAFSLGNGQTAVFDRLPQGTRYHVTEQNAEDGWLVLSNGAEGTIGSTLSTADFTNVKQDGALGIAKTFSGNAADKSMECSFDVTVKGMFQGSTDAEKAFQAQKYGSDGTVESLQVVFERVNGTEDGKATVEGIGHNEGVLIDGLQSGIPFTVEENGVAELESQGYVVSSGIESASSKGHVVSGTVSADGAIAAFFDNSKNEFGSLAIEKRISGNAAEEEAKSGRTFDFAVKAVLPDGSPLVGSFDATGSDGTTSTVLFENGTAKTSLKAPASSSDTSAVVIGGLPADTSCTVTEQDLSASGYTTTPSLTQSTTIAKDSTAKVSFANEKTYVPFSMPITGLEVLDGKGQNAGDFRFQLFEADGTTPVLDSAGNPVTATCKASEPGVVTTFALRGLRMTEPGTYSYIAKQTAGTQQPLSGVLYDQSQFTVNIGVSASATGKLSLNSLSYDVGDDPTFGVHFVNRYEMSSGEFSLGARKTLDGQAPQKGRFSFFAQETDPTTGKPLGAPLIAQNEADGTVTFPSLSATVPAGGTVVRTFVLSERIPSDANEGNGYVSDGIRYDTAQYLVRAIIADPDGDGNPTIATEVSKRQSDSTGANDEWEPLSDVEALAGGDSLPVFANATEGWNPPSDSDGTGGNDDEASPGSPSSPTDVPQGGNSSGTAKVPTTGKMAAMAPTGDGATPIAKAALSVAVLAGCALVLAAAASKRSETSSKRAVRTGEARPSQRS